jgi:nitroimidazol reductase NimA-like FMN-containing flavoprotein (pyridoxamine 5'-phosphate oxidase superfamily)
MPKTREELQEFMDRQRLASFATVDRANRPHVVPVFFTYRDGRVHVQASRDSVKVRNVLKNDNVAVAVYSGDDAVIIRGRGRVIDDEQEFIRKTQDHVDKYRLTVDSRGRDSLGIPLFNQEIHCVVEITPRRVVFW